jgi:hypothetical protein
LVIMAVVQWRPSAKMGGVVGRSRTVASVGLALAAVSAWGALAAHDIATGLALWSLDARVATIVLATSAVAAAGLNRFSALLIYLFGWLALDVLLGGRIADVGLVLLLCAWTVVVLLLGQRRAPVDASQRVRLVLLPMLVGGIAGFVSPALLLSRLATVGGQSASGLEAVVSAALPVLLAIGTVLCGFRAGQLVENRGVVSRRYARLVVACAAVLTFGSVGQVAWGSTPLATLSLATGGPLAVLALARGIPIRPRTTRLSSRVAVMYSMLGIMAIGGAVMTFAAAAAVTALVQHVDDGMDAAGLLATPGAILLGVGTGYVIWRAAREWILDPIGRVTDAPSPNTSDDPNGLAIAKD